MAERLRAIVSESRGFDAEDLPEELPLSELGLDSLMGMRIKNRIENDFQIPPLQVQTLRDASVADVIQTVEDAVAGREAAEPIETEPEQKADKPAGQGVVSRRATRPSAWCSERGRSTRARRLQA